jgi:hypothetical protein
MVITKFDKILLPSLEVDPIILLDEVLGVPYKVGAIWPTNSYGFDLHPLVDLFSTSEGKECYFEALDIATWLDFSWLLGCYSS